jgi:hypothetical protein
MRPGGMETIRAVSGVATMKESRSSTTEQQRSSGGAGDVIYTQYDNRYSKTGLKIVGWLVRATANGQTLAYKVSAPRFESFGKNPESLAAFRDPNPAAVQRK